MGIQVYMLDVSLGERSEKERREAERRLADRLSPARREKAAQLRFLEDRMLSLGAGTLLDLGLREYGLRERDVAWGVCGKGKPILPGVPGLHFNLSHSGELAMAVFSHAPVGCDVERQRQAPMRLAERFFCREELQLLKNAASKEEQNRLFYRIWTLKESYMKLTGEGMSRPLNSFLVRLGDPPRILLSGRPAGCSCVEIPTAGYGASACVWGEAGDVFFSFQKLADVL